MRARAVAAARGQAMVEMLVVLGFGGALYMGIWYLGKFHDLQSATIQAARYAAWERTVQTPAALSNARLEQQTRARLFMWNENAFKAADGKTNADTWGTQNAQWSDHQGRQRLIDRPRDIGVRTASSALPGTGVSIAYNGIAGIGKAVGAITGGEALPQGGLYTSNVRVQVSDIAALPAPLNRLGMVLNETSALVTDNWDASGPQQVAMRTRSYTPGAVMARVGGLMVPLQQGLSVIEPSFSKLRIGQVCPDVVPADRITGNSQANRPIYNGGGPCIGY